MPGAETLIDLIDRLKELRSQRHLDPGREARLQQLTAWQGERLARTHRDLLESPRYRAAVSFFLTDLYAPMDFRQRDHHLVKISPLLAKVLSDNALRTMGLALEMNILTEELDAAMERVMFELAPSQALTEESYARAYRRCGDADKRRRQIDLIREVGEDLDEIVTRPWIRRGLLMARRPARMSGLGELHQLLERGFHAFHSMRGAREFLDAIVSRERRIMERLLDRHPEPFNLDQG